jgi:hypothetical protein
MKKKKTGGSMRIRLPDRTIAHIDLTQFFIKVAKLMINKKAAWQKGYIKRGAKKEDLHNFTFNEAMEEIALNEQDICDYIEMMNWNDVKKFIKIERKPSLRELWIEWRKESLFWTDGDVEEWNPPVL